MLRASAEQQALTVDLLAARDPFVAAGLEHDSIILAFVDAIVLRDDDELELAREQLVDTAGAEVVEAVAAITANFEMMNRILDATGVPVAARYATVGETLGLSIPAHLRA